MRLCDVNVLIYATRQDMPRHGDYREWLQASLDANTPLGMSEQVLAAYVRIVTQPKFASPPTPLQDALGFIEALANHDNVRLVRPGIAHFGIFLALCRASGARGKLIADASYAALAIEHGCEWISTDSDFARFPGLHWRHPLDPSKRSPQ